MPHFEIREDDLTGDATRQLLTEHFQGMQTSSPPGHSFSLDLSGLSAPEITVWSAWDGPQIAGVVALKDLGDGSGELKSMRTATTHLRQGVAAALLQQVVDESRRRGWQRLRIETGSGENFAAALSFYRKAGFVDGEAFADYVRSEFNQFLHLDL